MGEAVDLGEVAISPVQIKAPETPDLARNLTDFGEKIPEGFVSVYVLVDPKNLDAIAREGLRTHYWSDKVPEYVRGLNDEIREVAAKQGKVGFDRQNTNFACVDNPFQVPPPESAGELEDSAVLEIKVDPAKTWVAEIYFYEQAFIGGALGRHGSIKKYVESAIPLKEYLDIRKNIPTDYLARQKYLDGGGKNDYRNPEVLTETDTPNTLIRTIKN